MVLECHFLNRFNESARSFSKKIKIKSILEVMFVLHNLFRFVKTEDEIKGKLKDVLLRRLDILLRRNMAHLPSISRDSKFKEFLY